MALEGNLCSFHRQSSSIVWDLPNFGVLAPETSLDVFSPFTSDLSSGYLEDALGGIKWSNSSSSSSCFKKRRMLSYPFDPFIPAEFSKNFWSCDIDDNLGNPLENSGFLKHRNLNPDDLPKSELKKFDLSDESSLDGFPSEITKGSCSPSPNPSPAELKEHNHSSSSLQRTVTSPLSKDSRTKQSLFASAESAGDRSNENTKVVYPFEMVKPGGIEGDMTLKDINKRILMRPTRPVRHPVGDLAFRPCVSTNGFGPSGKAVATLTRIHTQGRGSVTIIRTRG